MSRPGVHLRWAFNFGSWRPTRSECVRAFAGIQKEEQERIHKFVYQADAKASLIGRLMIRRAVARCLGVSNERIKLTRSERGRPVLDDPSPAGFEFNVSHAGSWTVLACQKVDTKSSDVNIKSETNLGVDVMPTFDKRAENLERFFNLMRRQFTDAEWDAIRSEPSEAGQLANFYRFWSLKESYVKAVGTGLNIDLRTIEFSLGNAPSGHAQPVCETTVRVNAHPTDWRFEECLLDSHCVSVAIRGSDSMDQPLGWTVMNIEDLIPPADELLRPTDEADWIQFSSKESVKPF